MQSTIRNLTKTYVVQNTALEPICVAGLNQVLAPGETATVSIRYNTKSGQKQTVSLMQSVSAGRLTLIDGVQDSEPQPSLGEVPVEDEETAPVIVEDAEEESVVDVAEDLPKPPSLDL
jgi:hypothetical protein